jgi:hypothetical protein
MQRIRRQRIRRIDICGTYYFGGPEETESEQWMRWTLGTPHNWRSIMIILLLEFYYCTRESSSIFKLTFPTLALTDQNHGSAHLQLQIRTALLHRFAREVL